MEGQTGTKRSVFVIGAGASNEVGLPLGSDLKNTIAKMVNFRYDDTGITTGGDKTIVDAVLQNLVKGSNEEYIKLSEAGRLIHDSMPLAPSIDNFIDVHSENRRIELVGKLAIIKSILDAEKASDLRVDLGNIHNTIDFKLCEKTWYNSFFQILIANCKKQDLKIRFRSIALIIFNYDRCIEHFLFHALKRYYNLDISEAAELIGSIEIYHPYGLVAPLPWASTTGSIEFGGQPKPAQLFSLINRIKTFTEETSSDSNEIINIRNLLINQNNNLIFLGFAFHKLNLDLLTSSPQTSHLLSFHLLTSVT